MPTAEKEALTIEPWAAAIGLGTLLLVTAVALFTSWDRIHTPSLEDVITPSAIGDTHYAPEPPGKSGPTGLRYQGQNLEMLAERKLREGAMIRVGTADSGSYTVYRLDQKPGKKDRLFMKVGPNSFMEVTAQ